MKIEKQFYSIIGCGVVCIPSPQESRRKIYSFVFKLISSNFGEEQWQSTEEREERKKRRRCGGLCFFFLVGRREWEGYNGYKLTKRLEKGEYSRHILWVKQLMANWFSRRNLDEQLTNTMILGTLFNLVLIWGFISKKSKLKIAINKFTKKIERNPSSKELPVSLVTLIHT